MDILVYPFGYVGLDSALSFLASSLNWKDSYKETFSNQIIRYLTERVNNWRKLTGLGFSLKKILGMDANRKLYDIDKKKFGKVLGNIEQEYC